jgi:uncharacterized membrane protein
VAAVLWLIFFPNAPYILTDFQHLANRTKELPIWYDVMMLIWFAFTGLLLGMVSLFLMQEIIRREFGRWIGWAFVALVAGLSSAGVYMGRFLRWNSWDILYNPTGIALYSFERAQNPSYNRWIHWLLVFFYFCTLRFIRLGILLLERPRAGLRKGDRPESFFSQTRNDLSLFVLKGALPVAPS